MFGILSRLACMLGAVLLAQPVANGIKALVGFRRDIFRRGKTMGVAILMQLGLGCTGLPYLRLYSISSTTMSGLAALGAGWPSSSVLSALSFVSRLAKWAARCQRLHLPDPWSSSG
eukprot:TRINITY_DN12123_c1_g2_i1.p1 TRINITY_DN12123_c1_g2~~TRINITY_DN12123_c1_g2_i1.p1  ORF type:complete len:116 (-),score=4.30 TRINITY_DN12123_c1_g2_i1:544-891(-)